MRTRGSVLPTVIAVSFLLVAVAVLALAATGHPRFPGRSEPVAAQGWLPSISVAKQTDAEPTGSISGTVRDSEGSLIEGAWIFANPSDVPISPPLPPAQAAGAYSGADGYYTIEGLGEGQFVVGAFVQGYVDEYYDGVRDPDDATLVSVTDGANTPGIDFGLDLGGKISGIITDNDGAPLEDVLVTASPTGTVVYVTAESPPSPPQPGAEEWAYTDADGAYTISGLTTGDYLVEAKATGYLNEYYDGARLLDDATAVSVIEDEETSGIDFVMDEGGTISGFVRDALGNPLPGAWVYADPVDWQDGSTWGDAYSAPDGSYTITGLATDSYIVEADAEGYVREYYDSVRDWSAATAVAVTENHDISGIDFALDIGGTISGTVTDSGGNPLEDCDVYADPIESDGTWGYGYTDVDGLYTVTGLATDSYIVEVWCDYYIGEYYDDARLWEDATPVDVTEGQGTYGIDFSLSPEGTITGSVVAAAGGPLTDAEVCASGNDIENCDWTDGNGDYMIHGLASGDYVVYAQSAGYVTEYYLNVRDQGAATPVSVTEGEDTPDIDFTLDVGGTISALIKDAGGNPIENAWVLASPSILAFTSAASPPIIPAGGGTCSTDANGECVIEGLATGNYIVSAGAVNYLTSYFDGATSENDADPVAVTEGESTSVELALDVVDCGDGNEDGRIGMVDAMLTARCVAGLIDCSTLNPTMADVNSSGSVSMVDAMMVAQYVAGLIPVLRCP